MGLVGKDWHQNVMAALDLVREEVVEATRQVEKSGGAEMTRGNRILARKALDYLDNLDDFMIDVENIGEKWDGLQKKIMGDVDDVREMVLPTKFRIKRGGYIRNVKEVAPWTNFTALVKTDSSIKFKTGGNSVLKINRGKDSDRYRQSKNGKSHARYYPETKVRLEFQGVKYYLTSQFAPEAIVPVVAWFAKKGIDASEICKIVEQINEMRLGGDLFANRN